MGEGLRHEQVTDVLGQLAAGETLSQQAAGDVFDTLLSGGLDDAQTAAVLTAIAVRTPTVDELVGAARAMRRVVTRVPYESGPSERLIDTCGTGGAPKTFNVSTAAAIVAASVDAPDARVVVAKHGNRSRTGRGSAEVLQTLGVNIDATPEQQARCLREAGVCFSFAIRHHPAMKHAAGVRKSLGFRTVFNLLGPLTNPAGARRQMIGVYSHGGADLVARTLAALGTDRSLVAHSDDGLDELSICAPSTAWTVENGSVGTSRVEPGSLGMESGCTLADLTAEGVEASAGLIEAVLSGAAPEGCRDIVLLNAGAAAFVAGVADSIGAGVDLARHAVDSGRSVRTLEALRRVSHEPA